MRILPLLFSLLTLTGCYGYPKTVTPVQGFDLDRYSGRWYEIARLDHSFERGMDKVTADYRILENGSVEVINRGYLSESDTWKQAVGKAKFASESDEGYLKVSFFGPFYGSYVVFGLDMENYQYAFVCGPSDSYLWLLARSPEIDEKIREHFITSAAAAGFNTENLIFVRHD